VAEAAYELGNGSQATAQDTVPLALWVAATHLHDYPGANHAVNLFEPHLGWPGATPASYTSCTVRAVRQPSTQ
jgi:hypothetical protein